MVQTNSTMLELGTKAPDFKLPDCYGKSHTLDELMGPKGVLIMFICNHCPFVIHVREAMTNLAREIQEDGIGVIAISSNDVAKYPDDSPEKMADHVKKYGYTFPYLYDESQNTAKAYRAACTPEFYLFDQDRSLVYRGQMDSSRPSNQEPNDGKDLRAACQALLKGQAISNDQKPSMGCNIKWKPGNEPDYY